VGPDGACTSMCENGVQVKVFGPFVGEIFVEEMSNFVVHGQNYGGQYIFFFFVGGGCSPARFLFRRITLSML
jgi:hypothetical protein